MDNCIHCLHLSKECTCNNKNKSDSIKYTGPNLPCTDINTNDNMTLVVQKLNDAICLTPITTTSSTSSTSTSSTSTSTTTSTTTIGILEFNDIDHTVWNNGQGDVGSNTSFGDSALKLNDPSAFNNTAFGVSALQSNTFGTYNTALGTYTLYSSTTGGYNTAIGAGSLESNTTGTFNTAVGANSLLQNTLGSDNVAIGAFAQTSIVNGVGNTAVGNYSLQNNTSDHNTAIGYVSLIQIQMVKVILLLVLKLDQII